MGSHTSIDSVRSILDDIRRIVQALRVSSREAEKRTGLSGAQLFVLQKLGDGQSLSVNELAARTHTHQSSVSVVAQRLVELKLISSTRSAADGRRMELTLTAKGRKVLKQSPGAAQDRLLNALRKLPTSKAATLAALLSSVVSDTGLSSEMPHMFFEETPKKGKQKRHGPPRNSTRIHHRRPARLPVSRPRT